MKGIDHPGYHRVIDIKVITVKLYGELAAPVTHDGLVPAASDAQILPLRYDMHYPAVTAGKLFLLPLWCRHSNSCQQ